MRLILKVILVPISLINFDSFSGILAWHRKALLYIVMTICVFVALGSSFMLHDTKAGIEALVIGFLLSPYGLPMIGATVIAFIKLINDRIKAA